MTQIQNKVNAATTNYSSHFNGSLIFDSDQRVLDTAWARIN